MLRMAPAAVSPRLPARWQGLEGSRGLKVPIEFVTIRSSVKEDLGARLIDVNGDALPDLEVRGCRNNGDGTPAEGTAREVWLPQRNRLERAAERLRQAEALGVLLPGPAPTRLQF
jgi:hypothetical protein